MNKKDTRPKNFEQYCMMSQEEELKHIVSRDTWLNENAKNIIDKVSSSDLPHVDQIDADNSKVGDFIELKVFQETYDEDGVVMDKLGDNGVLCYAFTDTESRTWWATKQEKGEISGLCRIK